MNLIYHFFHLVCCHLHQYLGENSSNLQHLKKSDKMYVPHKATSKFVQRLSKFRQGINQLRYSSINIIKLQARQKFPHPHLHKSQHIESMEAVGHRASCILFFSMGECFHPSNRSSCKYDRYFLPWN